MSQKIFVTGATGVIGRQAIPALIARGHQVTGVARSQAKAEALHSEGAKSVFVDLFNADQLGASVDGHDVVIHLATNIPTGASAATKRAWTTNDRLRTETSKCLASACLATSAKRYIGESITFPYVDSGDEWIDEAVERSYFWGNQSSVDAEAAAKMVADTGATGVVLRFAMFYAPESAHLKTIKATAAKGLFTLTGDPDAFISFISARDAAEAVVAAIEAPAGTYNVAEANPATRAQHSMVLAKVVGRTRLRSVPHLLQKAGGAGVESLSRSHRISAALLSSATGWEPKHAPLQTWEYVQ